MKTRAKKLWPILLTLLATVCLVWAQNKSSSRSVQVREAQLRDTPSFLGKVIGRVSYTEQVNVVEDSEPWQKVKATNEVEGWIHSSALSTKRIVLKSGDQNQAAGTSQEEVVIAGKGFDREVEEKYRQQYRLDYKWVDQMDQRTVDMKEFDAFVKEGELKLKGGQ